MAKLLDIHFQNQKTQATLNLYPHAEITRDQLLAQINSAINERGIKRAFVKADALEDAATQLLSTQEPIKDIVIAEGQPPENGINAKFTFTQDLFSHKSGKQLDDGSVDYKEIDTYKVVAGNSLLMVKKPPTPGKEGKAVTGEDIACKPGKDVKLIIGANVEVRQQDNGEEHIYATSDGAVVFNKQRLSIEVLTEIKVEGDVDYSIGNIKFPGDVYIGGGVLSGFKIEADGDIYIAGCIDNAIIHGKRDLHVQKGIINESTIEVERDIDTGFAQNSTLRCKGTIKAKDSLVDCEVEAGKSVAAGAIIGGFVRTIEKITAKNLGASMGTLTELRLGITKEEKIHRAKLKQQLELYEENFNKINEVVNKFNPSKISALPAEKQQQIKDLIEKRDLIQLKQIDLQDEMDALDKNKDTAYEEGYISASNGVFPGVTLYFNTDKLQISNEKSKISFIFNKGSFKIEEASYRE